MTWKPLCETKFSVLLNSIFLKADGKQLQCKFSVFNVLSRHMRVAWQRDGATAYLPQGDWLPEHQYSSASQVYKYLS